MAQILGGVKIQDGLLFGQKSASDSWKNGVDPKLSKKSGGVKPGYL